MAGGANGINPTTNSPAGGSLAPMTGSVFDRANKALGTSQAALTSTVQPGSIAGSMNQFLSPYRSQVINDAVGRIRDRRAIDMNMSAAGASMAGAYGGSRHGVLDAKMIDDYGREEDETVSRLLQSGFDTSAGLAAQQQGLMQSGAGALAGVGQTLDSIGRQANSDNLQAGNQQQQLLQAILSGGNADFDGYKAQPMQAVSQLLAAISGNPLSGNTTQSYKPGLFDYLKVGTGVATAGK